LVAGALFVLPGALAMWGLSWIYVSYGAVPAVAGGLHGLKAAVLAILAVAVVRVGRKSLQTPIAWALAVTAGAVLASWFHGLAGGGELQLSRMDYVTPNGRRLESDGVEPDEKVTRTLADLRAGRDVDLEAALRVWAEGR
jgi:hypothetical protein